MPVSYSGTAITWPDNSTTTSGWTGFKNRIINGNMAIFQRGTAATSDQTYSVDRWRFDKSNDATESVSQNSDAPTGFSYSLRNTISVGDATIGAAQFSAVQQNIEGYNMADLGWGTANAKTVTLSFWIRSSVTGQYTGDIRNSNDTKILPYNFTINAADTWEYKTVTIPGCTDGTWNTTNGIGMQVAIYAALGSNYTGGTNGVWGASPNYGSGTPVNALASNGNIFAVTGVQLERGSTASSFEYRNYGVELGMCQRYYQAFYGNSPGLALMARFNAPSSGNGVGTTISLHQTMRALPTVTRVSNFSVGNSGQPSFYGDTEYVNIYTSSTSSGDCFFYASSSSVGFTASAEL